MTAPDHSIKRQQAVARDVEILRQFVDLYCRDHHRTQGELCPECRQLLGRAAERRAKCPMDPKPKCRDCRVACHRQPDRDRIAEIMKYSSVRMLRPGRIGKLLRLVFGKRRDVHHDPHIVDSEAHCGH